MRILTYLITLVLLLVACKKEHTFYGHLYDAPAYDFELRLAHGYFLVGPEIVLGPLRDYPEAANLGGLVTAMAIVLLGTACMSAYGSVTFGNKPETPGAAPLATARGWGDLTAGFFLGGMGGVFAAYFLLENFAGIDAIFRGLVN
jgi:photosystem I subunit 11